MSFMVFEHIIEKISQAPIYIFLPVILIIVFIALTFIHKIYDKKRHKINPYSVLIFGYFLLVVNVLLKTKFYSIEWAFLGFIIVAVLYYDFKIDSRFLILPAILLLGYVPFLLIGKLNALAETIAIYVYYFLVAGVVLQLVEHVKKIENSIDFEAVMAKLLKKPRKINFLLVIVGIISIVIIIANRFYALELLKWTSVYAFAVILVLYALSSLKKQP